MTDGSIPVSAPITTDSAGVNAATAMNAVMRVICKTTGSMGTGFLHHSGWVITAEHVVRNSSPDKVILLTSANSKIGVSEIRVDQSLDLAIMKPVSPIPFTPLKVCPATELSIGCQVSTWGFPYGYNGAAPLLTIGYLSGVENLNGIAKWVINAAFNSGNSGGPVLRLEDGTVIGVAASKLAPLPPHITEILNALSQQQSGFIYTVSFPDGHKENLTEGRLIGTVLEFLRGQTQLVVGHAVLLRNLRSFLSHNGLSP